MNPRIAEADAYLASRTGNYIFRTVRYNAAATAMGIRSPFRSPDQDDWTVVDVGAGWTELDYYLRRVRGWRGRYIPVDACIDGVDLNMWAPPREAEWFVALEVLEHLSCPYKLIWRMQVQAIKGVVVSTPNPDTTDVLGMDSTHKCSIPRTALEQLGFTVEERSFYGKPRDSLFGVWRREETHG